MNLLVIFFEISDPENERKPFFKQGCSEEFEILNVLYLERCISNPTLKCDVFYLLEVASRGIALVANGGLHIIPTYADKLNHCRARDHCNRKPYGGC